MKNQKAIRIEKTWTSFLYTIFGVTLPFFLSLLGIAMLRKYEFIISFVDDGQFLLFSVGLLTSALYIFREEENQRALKKWYDKILSHGTFFILLFSSALYAILYTLGILSEYQDMNVWFIRISSLIIFIFAMIAAFRSIYIDLLKIYPHVDVKKISTDQVNNIMDQL